MVHVVVVVSFCTSAKVLYGCLLAGILLGKKYTQSGKVMAYIHDDIAMALQNWRDWKWWRRQWRCWQIYGVVRLNEYDKRYSLKRASIYAGIRYCKVTLWLLFLFRISIGDVHRRHRHVYVYTNIHNMRIWLLMFLHQSYLFNGFGYGKNQCTPEWWDPFNWIKRASARTNDREWEKKRG